MQELNTKCTIEDGVITIAQGVERIEEGTFCEVDFNELHVPASVKTLEYPLDLSEELEADIYLYGANTAIQFSSKPCGKLSKHASSSCLNFRPIMWSSSIRRFLQTGAK